MARAFLAACGWPSLVIVAATGLLGLAGGDLALAIGAAFVAAVYCLVFGWAPALLLGVPLYALLRGRAALTAARAGLFGGLIAAAPWALLALESPRNAAPAGLAFSGVGLIGGVVFWWMHQRSAARPLIRQAPPDAAP